MKISTTKERDYFIQRVLAVNLDKPWEMSAKVWGEPKKNRSLSQNKLAFKWYAEIERQSSNQYSRNFFKWTYGCPIVAETDDAFSEFYGKLMDNYTYEQCVDAMEYVSVTSMMKTKQFAEYLNHIEIFSVEHGYQLSHPEDLYDSAMGLSKVKPDTGVGVG